MQDQRELAAWADLSVADLSSFMSPHDLTETRKWISFVAVDTLPEASFKGIMPYPLIRGSVKNRFGVDEPQLHNRHHEQMVRRLMLSAVRTSLAARRFNEQFRPNLLLVAGGEDFISRSVSAQSRSSGIPVSLVRWNMSERAVKILHPHKDEMFSCALVLEGLSTMRGEVKTWPLELLTIIEDLSKFLGIDAHQLPLEMAR